MYFYFSLYSSSSTFPCWVKGSIFSTVKRVVILNINAEFEDASTRNAWPEQWPQDVTLAEGLQLN